MRVPAIMVIFLTILLAGCGSSANSNQQPTSGLKKRVLLSNPLGSAVLNPFVSPPIPVSGTGAVDRKNNQADRGAVDDAQNSLV